MKIETFFRKFTEFADAPNAVAKMRELVLHLAFSGRLLPHSTPWRLKPLKSLATKIGSGATPAGGRESYISKGIPLIRSMNVHFRGFNQTGIVYLSDEQARQLANVIVQQNDVLLNITGASIGRVTTAPRKMAGARVNQHVTIIRPTAEIDADFLAKFLASPAVQRMIDDVQVGATRQALTKGMIEQFEIPVPPLAEQKRIMAKVDELMSLCDRLDAQQQERESKHAALSRASLSRFTEVPAPANLNFLFHPSYAIDPADIRKTILTLAVQGKLVPQDPNDEPAGVLLERISRQKQIMIEAKQRRQGKVSRPQTALDAPSQLPHGWEWVNVDSFCYKVTDGTHFTPRYMDSGVRFVSAKDIGGGALTFNRCKFISQEEHAQLYRRCNPEYHDIVISKSGSIGTVALVEDRNEFSLFESLALLKFDQANLFPKFLVYVLTNACATLTTGHIRGVGVKHLHLDILRGLEMAIPPLAEQRRIVVKVDQLMALVDRLEAQLASSRATADKLMDAAVAELTGVA